jgi:hypothetical protein
MNGAAIDPSAHRTTPSQRKAVPDVGLPDSDPDGVRGAVCRETPEMTP